MISMKKIKLNDLSLGSDFNFYILAETAFSHEGDLNYLKDQVNAAFKGGANGIKFQILLDVEDSYQENTEIFRNFDNWKISEEDWIKIFKYVKTKNLEIIVLPIDMKSLAFVKKNIRFIDAIEIHSICFNQIPFLQEIKSLPITIILGIGGRISEDIDFTLNLLNLNNKSSKRKGILMYGFQSFPTDYERLNLMKLKSLYDKYSLALGYADHTSFTNYDIGNDIIKYAFLLGARLFEKHLVLEKGKERIDYESAISFNELIELRTELEILIKILGNRDLTKLNDLEIKYRQREKQLIVNKNLRKGESLSVKNIGFKVSNEKSDFEQKDYFMVLSKKLKKDIKKDEVLKFEHIDI
jgi:sialic acid synthase SpsE